MIKKNKTAVEKKKRNSDKKSKLDKISWKAGNMLYPPACDYGKSY